MRNLSVFNKIFLLFCAALFILLILVAPHDKEAGEKQSAEIVGSSE